MKRKLSTPNLGLLPLSKSFSTRQRRVQSAFALSAIQKKWKKIVGDFVWEQTHPKKIERNVLWVSVENSATHYELSFRKKTLLEDLEKATRLPWKDIRFIHEGIPPKKNTESTMTRQKFERVSGKEERLDDLLGRVRALSEKLQKSTVG